MLVIANLGFNDSIRPFYILVLLNLNWLVVYVLHMTDQYAYLMVESKGVWLALQLILKSKGLVRVYRGIGAGPAHTMYFLEYEIYKKVFSSGNLNNLTIVTVSAVSAMVTSDVVFTLINMVKLRVQFNNIFYKGGVGLCA
ncbi:hypothetical protein ACB092_05G076000 [Castanea dentata]